MVDKEFPYGRHEKEEHMQSDFLNDIIQQTRDSMEEDQKFTKEDVNEDLDNEGFDDAEVALIAEQERFDRYCVHSSRQFINPFDKMVNETIEGILKNSPEYWKCSCGYINGRRKTCFGCDLANPHIVVAPPPPLPTTRSIALSIIGVLTMNDIDNLDESDVNLISEVLVGFFPGLK